MVGSNLTPYTTVFPAQRKERRMVAENFTPCKPNNGGAGVGKKAPNFLGSCASEKCFGLSVELSTRFYFDCCVFSALLPFRQNARLFHKAQRNNQRALCRFLPVAAVFKRRVNKPAVFDVCAKPQPAVGRQEEAYVFPGIWHGRAQVDFAAFRRAQKHLVYRVDVVARARRKPRAFLHFVGGFVDFKSIVERTRFLRCGGGSEFDNVRLQTRADDPAQWAKSVGEISDFLQTRKPAAIFAPHFDDWNGTHIGTAYLVADAVEKSSYTGTVFQTEYWGGLKEGNLMVEGSPEYIAAQMGALALHAKEVERNDYHLRLPAWQIDNVRRGAEIVGGQGAQAPRFAFATLYNAVKFRNGKWRQAFARKFLSLSEKPAVF